MSRRSHQRVYAGVAVALVGGLILAGCSGGGDAGPADATCDGEITEGTVTMFAHEGAEADAIRAAIDAFNAGPGNDQGIDVDLTMIPEAQYPDQVNAAAASGDLPALLDLDGPTMANLAWNGSIIPIDDCISDDTRENMLPSLIEQGTYADKLWALGSFDAGLGLWAWRSALEEVGARIPESAGDAWTAEEFDQILRDLQAQGYTAPLDTKLWYGAGEWFSFAFAPVVWSAGGDLIDRTDYQTADGVLNGPESVEGLTTFQSWFQDGLVDTAAADDSNFLQKKSPISWVGHWMYPAYSEALGDDLVVLPLPDFGTGSKTGMGSWAWGISPNAGDPDSVAAVIEYLLSDEAVLGITTANGGVPGTLSAIEKSPLYSEGGDLALFAAQLAEAPEVAVPRPITPGYPAISQAMSKALDNIIQGANVQDTLDEAVTSIDEDIVSNDGYPAPTN